MAHQSKYPSLDRQWHKMMFSFFEYLPMQYRQATEREWQIRKMIWSFKDGKAYLNIAWMIANKLHQVLVMMLRILFLLVFRLLPLIRMNFVIRGLLRLCVSFQVLSMRMNIYVSVEIVWLFTRNLTASRFKSTSDRI